MIDLHCHMLPGVDDGSASEADSLEMGRIAARSGVTAIALTPHCNLPEGQGHYYDGALETRFRRLAMLFRQEGLPVTLYRGMEVFSTPELPRLLDEERLLTLGGSRYLLVEFAFGETPWFAAQTLESIAVRGLTPVVAHPERYYFIQDDPRRLLRRERLCAPAQPREPQRHVRPPRGKGRAVVPCKRLRPSLRQRRAQSLPAHAAAGRSF